MAKKTKKVIKIESVSRNYESEKISNQRVCSYCRVSSGSIEQKNSFYAQMSYYTKMIESRENWIFVGIYADRARSGTKTDKRVEFQKMLQDCRDGKIDLIITKSITRFARNTVDSIKTIRELKKLGIGVYFEKENINTLTENSEQLLTILSAIAQSESESISTNLRWSAVRRFQNGTFIISDPPFGYAKNEQGELIIEPETARIVCKIFDDYLRGKGCHIIANELEKENVSTIRKNGRWSSSTIKGILCNPVYEGDLLLQKKFTTSGVPFKRKKNHGEVPQHLVTNNHEPIITREKAEAVRQLFDYRRKKQCVSDYSVYQSRYEFSSRIKCGECKGTFRRRKFNIGKPYESIHWCCYQHIMDSSKCNQKSIREEDIKQAFVRMWNRLGSNYKTILIPMLDALKAVQDDSKQEQELHELEQKIQELKKQSHMLSKILIEEGMGSAIFIEKRNLIDTEMEIASGRIRQIKNKKLFEHEILQTEYLITVFKSQPCFIEEYEEELFLMTVEQITVLKRNLLSFRLKNGLELEEWIEEKVMSV